MTWNLVDVITSDHDDPTLYPVLSEDGDAFPFALEPADGPASDIRSVTAKEFYVTTDDPERRVIVQLSQPIDMYVTDSRIVVVCEKYTTGGGYVGFGGAAAAIAVTANAVSKARAARRRKGTALMGHVRYPWLAGTMAKAAQGWSGSPNIRVAAMDGTTAGGHMVFLTMAFPKRTDVRTAAIRAYERAVTYRVAHTRDDEERANLAAQLPAGTPELRSDRFSVWGVPTYSRVRRETAFPAEC